MEKSNFFERILQVSEYQKYKNITDFAKNGLLYSSPQKLLRLKDGNNSPSVDILIDISNKFEHIDLRWLLTGKGQMLTSKPFSIVADPGETYEISVSDKNLLIKTQKKLIEQLEDKLRVTLEQLASITDARNVG